MSEYPANVVETCPALVQAIWARARNILNFAKPRIYNIYKFYCNAAHNLKLFLKNLYVE